MSDPFRQPDPFQQTNPFQQKDPFATPDPFGVQPARRPTEAEHIATVPAPATEATLKPQIDARPVPEEEEAQAEPRTRTRAITVDPLRSTMAHSDRSPEAEQRRQDLRNRWKAREERERSQDHGHER